MTGDDEPPPTFDLGGFGQPTVPRKPFNLELLRGSAWLTRDIPPRDCVLGELLSTTSRMLFSGPTGRGKSMILLAWAFAIADGTDFLNLKGSGKPRNVIYFDGEMPSGLAQRRMLETKNRHARMPPTFYYFNSEDFSDHLKPLTTKDAQHFFDRIIKSVGGADFIILDNIQAFAASSSLREDDHWQKILPWAKDLTRRLIGQIWAHHTGYEKSHGYGDSAREWQMDTVVLLKAPEKSDSFKFTLEFTKHRYMTPENRKDFEAVTIELIADRWHGTTNNVPDKADRIDCLMLSLPILINEFGQTVPEIPNRVIPLKLWKDKCPVGQLSEPNPDAHRTAFNRLAKELEKSGRIAIKGEFVWSNDPVDIEIEA